MDVIRNSDEFHSAPPPRRRLKVADGAKFSDAAKYASFRKAVQGGGKFSNFDAEGNFINNPEFYQNPENFLKIWDFSEDIEAPAFGRSRPRSKLRMADDRVLVFFKLAFRYRYLISLSSFHSF